MSSFDLLTRPWIPVIRDRGTHAQIGLIEAFEQAEHIKAIAAESAQAEVALTRLLLAIHWAANTEHITAGDHLERLSAWTADLQDSTGVRERAVAHLRQHAHRFDLLSDEHPFMQTPAAAPTKEWADLSVLDASEREGRRSTRDELGLRSYDPAAAARAMLVAHAYDTGGIKSPVIGHPEIKAGKVYGAVPGTAGIGVIHLVLGADLASTLTLNSPYARLAEVGIGTPFWLREPIAVTDQRAPDGLADFYAYQARHVRLHRDESTGMIDGAVSTRGLPLGPWRELDPAVAIKQKTDSSLTLKQGLRASALDLVDSLTRRSIKVSDGVMGRPLVLDWLEEAAAEGAQLPLTPLVRAVLQEYTDSKRAKVSGLVDVQVPAPMVLLAHRDLMAEQVTAEASAAAFGVRRAFTAFLLNLSRAAGAAPAPGERPVDDHFEAELDRLGRRWLASITADTDLDAHLQALKKAMSALALDRAHTLIATAPLSAVIGRTDATGRVRDAASALNLLTYKLKEITA